MLQTLLTIIISLLLELYCPVLIALFGMCCSNFNSWLPHHWQFCQIQIQYVEISFFILERSKYTSGFKTRTYIQVLCHLLTSHLLFMVFLHKPPESQRKWQCPLPPVPHLFYCSKVLIILLCYSRHHYSASWRSFVNSMVLISVAWKLSRRVFSLCWKVEYPVAVFSYLINCTVS